MTAGGGLLQFGSIVADLQETETTEEHIANSHNIDIVALIKKGAPCPGPSVCHITKKRGRHRQWRRRRRHRGDGSLDRLNLLEGRRAKEGERMR